MALCGSVVLAAGCARNELPYAVSENLRLDDDERSSRLVLEPEQQAEITRVMSGLADDHEPRGRIAAAADGRFSDVPEAVSLACNEVEMAVVREHEEAGSWTFELKTIEGLPGTLRVAPGEGDQVYEATAAIGRHHLKVDRTEALLAELQRQLLILGKKRKYVPGA